MKFSILFYTDWTRHRVDYILRVTVMSLLYFAKSVYFNVDYKSHITI
jgi:hypothetical protein